MRQIPGNLDIPVYTTYTTPYFYRKLSVTHRPFDSLQAYNVIPMSTFMDKSHVRYLCFQQAPELIESQKECTENHEQLLTCDLLGSRVTNII